MYFRIRWRQSGTTTCRVWSARAFKLRRHRKRFLASTIPNTKLLVRSGGHIICLFMLNHIRSWRHCRRSTGSGSYSGFERDLRHARTLTEHKARSYGDHCACARHALLPAAWSWKGQYLNADFVAINLAYVPVVMSRFGCGFRRRSSVERRWWWAKLWTTKPSRRTSLNSWRCVNVCNPCELSSFLNSQARSYECLAFQPLW